MAIQDNFILLGISHRTAHVDIRERFSVTKDMLADALDVIASIEGVAECVLLSTCNRTELYVLADHDSETVTQRLQSYFLSISGMKPEDLKYFYSKRGISAAEHLFRVTSGLDSLIFGEPQIFGQVKYAYSAACDKRCTGPVFNRLFHCAIQVGKQIRSGTSVQKGIVSLSSAAVLLAEKAYGSLGGRSALLIGTGKIGTSCARQFVSAGIETLYICNRTPEHAREIAEELSGRQIPYDTMVELLGEVDIVVTSVSSPDPVITGDQLSAAMQCSSREKLVIIDLGVPRNVDHEAACMANVDLFNIDDMENLTSANLKKRKQDLHVAEDIIALKIREYSSWLDQRNAVPVLNDLHEQCEAIRKTELERITNKVDDATLETIDILSRRIVRKILHNPTMTVKTCCNSIERERLLATVSELFMNETG